MSDVSSYIPNNSLALNKLALGNRCGFYVSNAYNNTSMSLYPPINVTADTIVYIDYTSGTSINLASLTGTTVLPVFNS